MKYILLLAVSFCLCPATQSFGKGSGAGKNASVNVYKRLEGTIANQAVVMYLTRLGDTHRGYYFYKKIGEPIPLWGYPSVATNGKMSGDSLILSERPWGDTVENALRLRVADDNSFSGVWMGNGNGKPVPIKLTESYPKGSYTFEQFDQTDLLGFNLRGRFQDTITSTYSLTLPSADVPRAEREFILSKMGHYLGCDTLGQPLDLADCAREQSKRYLDSSRADIVADAADLADSEFADEAPRFSYYESVEMAVRYNEDGILVLDDASSFYAGGAHGMYGVLAHVFDVQNKKELTLKDVTTADSVTLERAVEEAFRREYHLPTNQKLSETLFEDYLPANDNFYITNKGVGFVYNPYEVASFAAGIVEVFVPYTALKGTLTPWFKERMGL